ncbi:MAG: T9SS type A sorting domain-containing protein [Ignavibacteriaceae bacterium]|nr:T9SS type A sorting domain-containing protein [Ignavibacteriaceae bacterium]
MIKRFFGVLTLLVLLTATGYSQWQFAGVFPDSSDAAIRHTGNIHGLAVDPAGKVWVMDYYALARDRVTVPYPDPNNPAQNLDSNIAVRALYVFNPDGTLHTFPTTNGVTVENPIKFYRDANGAVVDTLAGWYPWFPAANYTTTGRGMRADANGDIVAVYFSFHYKFDYKTGFGLGKVAAFPGAAVSPGISKEGNKMFAAQVVGGTQPIKEYDNAFSYVGDAVPFSVGFSRSFEVAPDGNTIYWAGYTLHGIYVYKRADEFSVFDSVGVVLKGFDSESFGWDPATGWLWASAGSGNDLPNRYVEPDGTPVVTSWSPNTWYGYDVANDMVVDSISWHNLVDGVAQRPRAIAFSPTGDTVYVGNFGSSAYVGVQRFINNNRPQSLRQENNSVVKGFDLVQNYPNPFNPSTQIKFSVAKEGMASLKVYDMLGREVAVLVNENLTAGQYIYTFNGTNLASGTYVYELNQNGTRVAKKMLLMK